MSKGILKTKLIVPIVLAAALTSCTIEDLRQYDFHGKIVEDSVSFCYLILGGPINIMNVTKPDGRNIAYVDHQKGDLKVEYVRIINGDQETKYTPDNYIGKEVLEEAQKQFDSYLEKIIEIKTAKALKDLK